MGGRFNEELFSAIKTQLNSLGSRWADQEVIPKRVACILASIISDIESYAKYNPQVPSERINQAVADMLEITDYVLGLGL